MDRKTNQNPFQMNHVIKIVIYLGSGIMGFFSPIFPLLGVCLSFVIIDCFSAYRLSCRVANHPEYKESEGAGKFNSNSAKKILPNIAIMWACVILAFMLDAIVLKMMNGLYLANWMTGIACGIQALSILENEASCNGSKWAKVASKVLVDKTKRHLDIDLNELK